MPHSVSPQETQAEADDLLIEQALNLENSFDFTRELEPGTKADDAVDFEDISDDDLAEDEDEKTTRSSTAQKTAINDLSHDDLLDSGQGDELADFIGQKHVEGDGLDDLFGDVPSSPTDLRDGQDVTEQSRMDMSFAFEEDGDDLFAESFGIVGSSIPTVRPTQDPLADHKQRQLLQTVAKQAAPSKEQLLQQELFAMSRFGLGNPDYPPAPPENQEELLQSLWPKFERDTVPRFMDLLPPKKARYIGKIPLKVPKPVQPTKVSLELAADQEKSFRLTASTHTRSWQDPEQQGFVAIPPAVTAQSNSEDEWDVDSDFEGEPIGGVTWDDIKVVCEDWDVQTLALSTTPDREVSPDLVNNEQEDLFRDMDDEWEQQMGRPSAKRRKLESTEANILKAPHFELPPLHDPEQTTTKIARCVILDLNDPQLLIDEDRSGKRRPRNQFQRADSSRNTRNSFTKGLSQRYNISNDEAYDLLKENHQSKVRSTLGNLAISHSMPALRLQWPYYKTKLAKQEARSFHRPTAYFSKGEPIMFSKPRIVKRKHMKGKTTQDIFQTTKDISLGDNSNVLLLEYSEEHPIMMSNFGMGSRLVNYYRRKNMEDTTRPKLDIGETTILLPQDKSPFSIFGHVDPGQITPTLHNSMYRAPIFKQEPRPTDFLMIRNATGVEGSTWYLRKIENIHVVGQQFPSTDVPGPHSRKVTTASKNRLKMISYRYVRRNKPHRVGVSHITQHFADTTDMQNRQKMKEFMKFNKDDREWEMRPGESIPDSETIRSMVKPEDVCLLESMQVGQQHLQDAGFTKENEESDEEEGKEGQSIEQQLAPWYTSRNFLHAASGKAMLQLHGEGDPTGRGEAFSFLKTSMKGGFKAVGESVEDKLDAKKLKELGGHSYNVAKQQRSYEESIRRIWEGQKQSLSSTIEHSDTDMDQDDTDEVEASFGRGMTPRSEAQTPVGLRRRDDETTSQFSKFSTDSQSGKVLRVTRYIEDKYKNIEQVQEIVRDPRVIRQYLKRRHAMEDQDPSILERGPTGDAERDRRAQKNLMKELARLERNKDRRIARDKQKGTHVEGPDAEAEGSPNSPGATPVPKGTGTQRKCANCGQVGHIKTNKKLCPLLNGTMKQEDGFTEAPFAMGTPVI